MAIDKTLARETIERYEYKYRVTPDVARAIRHALSGFCDLDAASDHGPYLISSLYLDSPSRVLYRQSRDRRPHRLKLRVRRYAQSPPFLEIKERHNRVVIKTRVPVDASLWPVLLYDAGAIQRYAPPASERGKLWRFLFHCLRLRVEPSAVVRYRRQAWVSRYDRYARVTFDHHLEALRALDYSVPVQDGLGWLPFDDPRRLGLPSSGVILELKCTTHVPAWMIDLVRRFNLQPLGFSKYAMAVETFDRFPRDLGPFREPSRWLMGELW